MAGGKDKVTVEKVLDGITHLGAKTDILEALSSCAVAQQAMYNQIIAMIGGAKDGATVAFLRQAAASMAEGVNATIASHSATVQALAGLQLSARALRLGTPAGEAAARKLAEQQKNGGGEANDSAEDGTSGNTGQRPAGQNGQSSSASSPSPKPQPTPGSAEDDMPSTLPPRNQWQTGGNDGGSNGNGHNGGHQPQPSYQGAGSGSGSGSSESGGSGGSAGGSGD